MPNWCTNKLTIKGAPALLDAFVQKAHGPVHHFKPSAHDMRMIAQRHQAAIDSGGDPPEDEAEAPRVVVLSFHQLVPIPDEVMARAYDGEVERPTKTTGGDWERKLWGVKWGACDPELVSRDPWSATYSFDTAWGPPDTFLETLAQNYPDLIFALSFGEEYPSRGRMLFRRGAEDESAALSEQGGPDVPMPPNATDEDEERVYAMRKGWQNEYLDTHEAWAKVIQIACFAHKDDCALDRGIGEACHAREYGAT